MPGLAGLPLLMAVAVVAWWMALVPLAVLGWRRAFGVPSPWAWWVVAGVLGVSWVADTTALFLPGLWRWAPSLLYPAVQAAVVAWAWLERPAARRFVLVLTGLLLVAIFTRGLWVPDDMVRTMAWLGAASVVWDRVDVPTLRWTLLLTFGLGWVTWVWHLLVLTAWPTWYLFQATRAAGILVFSRGVWSGAADAV